ncbi:MAG: tetratricopeptide repeat protein [Terriglobales bacterium]|jgi:Flp pilus assembly protein TadD
MACAMVAGRNPSAINADFFRGLLLVGLLTAGAIAQDHTTVRHYKVPIDDMPPEIAQAEDAIQKNDFTGAETLLKKAIDKDPKNYQAWFDLGFVLNHLDRIDDSIHAYRQSVAAKPDVFETNLNLGLMLARLNSPEAERFLRAATTLKPTSHSAEDHAAGNHAADGRTADGHTGDNHVEEGQARAWLALGHLLENPKPEDAFQAYRKVAELMPKDPEPHLSAGLLHEQRKEFSDAEAEYKQALALDAHSTEAAIGLTNIYMKSGRLGDAEPLLRGLAAERPDDAGIHLQLGRILAAQGKKDDAIAEIQIGVKLAPGDSDAQRDLADLYASAGKNDLAETAYRGLVTAHPNDAELHRGLGKALLLQKKFPEAEKEFLAAVRLKRDSPDAYVDLAWAASENKNYDLAIRALNGRALISAEMPAICFFLRASAYDHLRDYKLAAVDYHHFLDVAKGKYPDQEWQATHRLIAIEPKKP